MRIAENFDLTQKNYGYAFPVKKKCKCKFNVKDRGCFRNHPSEGPMIKCLTIPDRIGIWKCWFLRRGENRSTRRKTSRSKKENQQQTQPTYHAGSGNRTRDTLVGGERSHHCAIHAPINNKTTVPLDVVPERRTKRFPPRFRPVGRFCELRFEYLLSPTGSELIFLK